MINSAVQVLHGLRSADFRLDDKTIRDALERMVGAKWKTGKYNTAEENVETLITSSIPDQAALQGILTNVFNLRLPLASLGATETRSDATICE